MNGLARGLLALIALAVSPVETGAQSATVAWMQNTADQAARPADEEIVVTGSRDRERAIRNYVEAITVESGDQIAKFTTPTCPASFGLPPGHTEVIVERMRLIAEHLGIDVAGRDCRPNVIVLVTENGGDFILELRRERPDLFAAFELQDIRAVMRLDGPVRAWQVIEARGADGRPMERISWLEMSNGPPRYIPRGYRLDGVMPSLTQRPTRQDLTVSFIVFDLDAIEGLTLLQIADHAAMRALARTAVAGLPARHSILTLFRDREAGAVPAEELTIWDAAYLRALYRTTNTVTAHQQRANIARSMRRDIDSLSSR